MKKSRMDGSLRIKKDDFVFFYSFIGWRESNSFESTEKGT
jgi:hypothetical protein